MIRFNSAGRVQPVEGMYVIHPGTCFLCGKVPDHGAEYFASLGVELEYYGMAYLCVACCKEVADFVGYVDPDKFEDALSMNDNLVAKNLELQNSLKVAKGLVNARIDSANGVEPSVHGIIGTPIPQTESRANDVDSLLNEYKSKSTKSSKG